MIEFGRGKGLKIYLDYVSLFHIRDDENNNNYLIFLLYVRVFYSLI